MPCPVDELLAPHTDSPSPRVPARRHRTASPRSGTRASLPAEGNAPLAVLPPSRGPGRPSPCPRWHERERPNPRPGLLHEGPRTADCRLRHRRSLEARQGSRSSDSGRNAHPHPRSRRVPFAQRTARGDTSLASTLDPGSRRASATLMAPVPVPISTMVGERIRPPTSGQGSRGPRRPSSVEDPLVDLEREPVEGATLGPAREESRSLAPKCHRALSLGPPVFGHDVAAKHEGAVPDEPSPTAHRGAGSTCAGRPSLESSPRVLRDLRLGRGSSRLHPSDPPASRTANVLLPLRALEGVPDDMHQGIPAAIPHQARGIRQSPRDVPPHPPLQIAEREGRDVGRVKAPVHVSPEALALE